MDERRGSPQGTKHMPVKVAWNETRGEQALEEAVEGVSAEPKEGV